MIKQALGTAVAAVFATAIAGAQAPAQGQQDYQAGGQMLTVEGCLQQDRAESAQIADAARDDDKTFLLVSAEVQQDVAAMPSPAPGEPAVGTTGQPGTQAETPIGTSGAADAAVMSATKFKVAGLDEERLAQYEGQRVRIQGQIARAEDRGAAGVERPGDARPESDRTTADPTATGTAATPESTTPGVTSEDHSRMAAAGDIPKLKATSIQPIEGTCPESPESR